MKKTWTIFCLAALLTLPLAGCAGDPAGSDMGGASASPSPSQTIQSPSASPDANPGDDDLAGSDGVVGGAGGENDASGAHGGTGVNDAAGTGNGTGMGDATGTDGDNSAVGRGRSNDSALERAGEGIRDTLDDMGSAARRMGQDATRAIER